jgi:hypothetical protein
LGSLLNSVHKLLGILARNKKYANFLIIGRYGDGACSFLSYSFHFKASLLKYGAREDSCTNQILNLSIFCATKSKVSVVPLPHLFSYLFFIWHKKEKKTSATGISNNKNFI